IQQALLAFHGQVQDDLSLVEVTLVEGLALTPAPLAFVGTPQPSPLDWSARFELRAETLRNFNPLPSLLQLLLQVHELRHQAGTVYTVLAEL
ncbi:fused response regulator/phosphatase, partial [Escherichia coli]|nr:fused response regulator/phosphatase [Escherichia coli]